VKNTLNFVMAGHVDHGKSTLIGRLLYDTGSLPPDKIEELKKASRDTDRTEFAYVLDHLEEERRQGITIDTTQVFFGTDERDYVIIDAPGHVEFLKNMITGASQAEAAVLIVDAEEGVKEQTRRHACMLSLLGIDQVIVVLNKMDLVGFKREKYDSVKDELEKALRPFRIAPRFYVPACAIDGDNVAGPSDRMPWYEGPFLLKALDLLENAKISGNDMLIMPVQDVYKHGDVRRIAGRVESGTIRQGDAIKILPGGTTSSVSFVERYPEKVNAAMVGQNVGIGISDPLFAERGDVICLPGKEPALTDMFTATVFWISKAPFSIRDRITIRCATQETTCSVVTVKRKINSSDLGEIKTGLETLNNLEVAEVVMRVKRPLVVQDFSSVRELGRFVLARGEDICAGGIVTGTSVPAARDEICEKENALS